MDTGRARLTPEEARRLTYMASAPDRIIADKLYDDCCKMIRAATIQQRTSVVFAVPVMQFGLPRYNLRLMRDILASRMKREGWAVGAVDTDSIRVGWAEPATSTPGARRISRARK